MTATLAAVIGWIAVPIQPIAFQLPGRKAPILGNAIVSALIATHFALLGAWIGAAVGYTAALSGAFQVMRGQALPMRVRIGVACAATAVAATIGWEGLVGLLPLTAFAIARGAETLDDDLKIRGLLFIPQGIWLVYSIATGAIPPGVLQVANMASNTVGIARHHTHRLRRAEPARSSG